MENGKALDLGYLNPLIYELKRRGVVWCSHSPGIDRQDQGDEYFSASSRGRIAREVVSARTQ
jgi:hypothetical protein